MYAIFEDGSHQYRVSEGELVTVDFRDVDRGTRLEFNKILLYQNGDDTRIGQPLIEGIRVIGDVVDHPSTKVYIQKFRRRKNSRRFKGHRQWYTKVMVRHILLPGQEVPAAPAPQEMTQSSPAPEGSAPANS